MNNSVIFSQTSLEEIRVFISEAVAAQCKQCQLNKPAEPEKLLTRKGASRWLDISLPTLSEYTKNGIIRAFRIGSSIRYRQSDVEDALQCMKTSKSK